jgi:adenosine deaminase
VCTKIGREYALAAALGFSEEELLGFTHAAVRASFAPADRRAALLLELQGNSGARQRDASLYLSITRNAYRVPIRCPVTSITRPETPSRL